MKAFKRLAKFFQTDDLNILNGKQKFFKRMAWALKQLAKIFKCGKHWNVYKPSQWGTEISNIQLLVL